MKPLPSVVCRGWFSSTGVQMSCAKPIIQPGEEGGEVIQGQCRLCMDLNCRASEILYRREYAAVQRRKATGRCKSSGMDPFRGFREG